MASEDVVDEICESVKTTCLYFVHSLYTLAKRALKVALEDPRGSAKNESQELML